MIRKVDETEEARAAAAGEDIETSDARAAAAGAGTSSPRTPAPSRSSVTGLTPGDAKAAGEYVFQKVDGVRAIAPSLAGGAVGAIGAVGHGIGAGIKQFGQRVPELLGDKEGSDMTWVVGTAMVLSSAWGVYKGKGLTGKVTGAISGPFTIGVVCAAIGIITGSTKGTQEQYEGYSPHSVRGHGHDHGPEHHPQPVRLH